MEEYKDKYDHDYVFRVVLIGDSGIGKTCLLKRLIDSDNFNLDQENPSTYGVDFMQKIFSLDKSNVKVCIHFYDTSGAEHFRNTTKSYLFYVQAYLILYDVNKMSSFLNCQYWLDEIRKKEYNKCYSIYDSPKKYGDNLIKILIGCKNDLDTQNKNDNSERVPTKKAREFARKNGFVLFFETSAKDDLNIKELFDEICLELITNYINYLNYQLSKFDFATPEFNISKWLVFSKSYMSVPAMLTKSDVYFNCKSESLNCDHIILNNQNLKRKNLQTKGFSLFDFF